MSGAAGDDEIGIAGAPHNRGGRYPEPFGGQLRERGLMALAGALRADDHLDPAFGANQDFGALARSPAGGFDVVADRDAAAQSAPPRRAPTPGKSVPVGELHRLPHHADVV